MKKHVWIMNHYAGSMYFDLGGRHYSFAKYLKQAGYEPVVFCANSKHDLAETWFPNEALWHEHAADEIGVTFVFVKARTYTGNGKQRILNMVDFYRNVKKAAKEYAAKHGKPDVIYASSVHPLTLVAGIRLAKRFRVRCVCEVRDLWPESLVAYGFLKQGSPVAGALYAGEKWIYKKADRLIFTFEGGYDYILERGWQDQIPRSKVYYINNGVDLETFQYNRDHYRVEDPDLDDPNTIKVVYAGSIRRANNMGALLDAAKKAKDPRICFLVWGDGDELPILKKRVQDEKVKNVIFKDKVEKKYVPSIVSRANINLIHYADQAIDIVRFGISLNKLFDYFAAGKPVIMDKKTSYNPIEQSCCGVVCEKSEDVLETIEELAAMPEEEYQAMCCNARRAAEEYDFKNLTRKLTDVIEGIEKK